MRGMTLIFLFCALLAGNAMANHDKVVLGFIEKVTLVDNDLVLSAKLDTGAKSASLNATKITKIEKNNKPYLKFIVPSKAGDMSFTCEYVGTVNIKIRSDEKAISPLVKASIDRPVVLMRLKLGNEERIVRVNLTNRKRFVYPLLLGREAIIAFNSIIDPSLKYTVKSHSSDHS
jgi:hypothetical protein